MRYFEQTRTQGVSKWWHWGFVFWITVLGWITAQMIITSPLPNIAHDIDPELGTEFLNASMEIAETADPVILTFSVIGFLLSTVAGLIFSLLAFNSKKKPTNVFGVIAGVFIGLSFLCLCLLAPYGSSEAATAVLNRLLAVSPTSYALILLTFPASLVMLYVGQKHVLKRTITSLHTGFSKFFWQRSFHAFFVTWGVLGTIAVILHVTGITSLSYTFDPTRFAIYAAISLALLPLQSATEEIVFRGYLNQALENIFRNKWIAFILTSLLFMSLHLANPEALKGAEAGILPIVMSGYFFFGFACCLLVLIDDGLESAIGVHAANNTFAAIFVNYENSVLPTPSVFQVKGDPKVDSVLTIITLSVIVLILYKTSLKNRG